MKKNILTATLLAMPLMFFTACSDFLDTAPDNRIEINTPTNHALCLFLLIPTSQRR